MTEAQVLGLFASLVGLIGGVLAVWWRIEGRIREAEKAASDRDTAIAAHVTLVSTQLSEYKTHVAENFVTKAGMREMRDEIMTGVREIKGSVSAIHERIDQIILAERPAEKRRPSS